MEKKINIEDKEFFDNSSSKRHRNQRPFSGFHDDNSNRHTRGYRSRIVETRLFTSRDKLVEYVNEKGKSDALIDIYKIEDELYKLVIKR